MSTTAEAHTLAFAAMAEAVLDGDVDRARALAQEALGAEMDLLRVIEEGFAAGIRQVGELWEEGEYFLPELVQGAEAMAAAMELLQPALAAGPGGTEPLGRVVVGTVKGDLHDIGKTLVGTLLRANGFQVHDLGADVSVDAFIRAARELDADIIGASALLTTTMPVQRSLVEAVHAEGLRARVMVGGAPSTPAWAEEIGASFAENAQRAVGVAKGIVAGVRGAGV